ncbi:LOW QUALITY PROTEIN: DNA-directed DNA/RNA polymerase mu [Brienomyrus brachyistius]|uniref:LOW QUALITY PROTEIN: DNA-directed DNA/RNA polymerase mu n=1 Tax=Brienomyrus brachyistius TaxID=42636 RepID=UPI0020B2FCD2|nr:LOW QUALITY PROTEIN: DNA-directed DNA/RNA polymerase mu [Brienomyrus brachyistius]
MIPLKRRKTVPSPPGKGNAGNVKFPDIVIFLFEKRMGASRRAFLSRLSRSKGFLVEDSLCQAVTHIVSEKHSGEEVQAWLESQVTERGCGDTIHLLDITWFTESMREGCPVRIEDRHRLRVHEHSTHSAGNTMDSYACQRRTPLQHHNMVLTDALQLLSENAEFCENEGRSVAFKRASAVLKALPRPVRSLEDLRGLPCLGEHSRRVIKEILEDGVSSEVEATRQSEKYQAMKALTGIFGVGVKTAELWFREGVRRPTDLEALERSLNRAQAAGLLYYEDLSTPVTKVEADLVEGIVGEAVRAVLPGAQITLTGGVPQVRLGKQTGHDVDLLITHPEEGREEELLPKVIGWLEARDLLLYQKIHKNSYLEAKEWPARPSSNMDRFERCFTIFKLLLPHVAPQGNLQAPRTPEAQVGGTGESRGWKAVRVDLVVTPISQYAFALLGWTGSQLFERELRRWAGQEKGMSLSSHALFHSTRRQYLRATSEEDIFAHLGLEFIPPAERNA